MWGVVPGVAEAAVGAPAWAWAAATWDIMLWLVVAGWGNAAAAVVGACCCGFGALCWNTQCGLRQPPGWSSQKHGVAERGFSIFM